MKELLQRKHFIYAYKYILNSEKKQVERNTAYIVFYLYAMYKKTIVCCIYEMKKLLQRNCIYAYKNISNSKKSRLNVPYK